MERQVFRTPAAVVAALLLFACGREHESPLGPQTPDLSSSASEGAARSASETHGLELTAVEGEGTGLVNVTTTAADQGTFHVQIAVSVHGANPGTTFAIKRAVDFTVDGNCASSSFLQFPLPNPGPLATLTTSPRGAGAAHIDFGRPIPSGSSFDVWFQVVTPGTDLRTECFTVDVK